MALLRWLQPRNGLPDPRGSLSSSILSQAIAAANREVEEAIRTASSGKRAPYGHYSPTVWAIIGKYACSYECTSLFHTPPCLLHVKFLQKAHSVKILLSENFSREPFITQKFPNILLPCSFPLVHFSNLNGCFV